MSALAKKIKTRIELSGPISVADYFMQCLFDPEHGYYVKQQPFGAEGDFITAPGISQMFGELAAGWVADCWQKLGRPTPFTLCELGPGDGTWMSDILRALKQISPDLISAAKIILIEQSPRLIEIQKQKLATEETSIRWQLDIADLPKQPTIFIANELLDALPIRQYVKSGADWLERVVTLNDNGALCFGIGTGTIDKNLLPLNAERAESGSVFEYAPTREAVVQQLAEKLVTDRGAALLIDYGHTKSELGDTLQAVKGHKPVSVFAAPGESDLTSHVDFEALTIAAKQADAAVKPILNQADFLLGLGLLERAGQLGAGKDEHIQNEISAAVHRLAGNGQNGMGDLFKVICITHPQMATPAPFAQPERHASDDAEPGN